MVDRKLPSNPRKPPFRKPPDRSDGVSIKLEIKVAAGTMRSLLHSGMQAIVLYMRCIGLL